MKGALIAVSIFAGLLTVTGIFFGVKYAKLVKESKNPETLWNKYVMTLPAYATNADALEAGLKVGDKYRNPTNEVKIVVAA